MVVKPEPPEMQLRVTSTDPGCAVMLLVVLIPLLLLAGCNPLADSEFTEQKWEVELARARVAAMFAVAPPRELLSDHDAEDEEAYHGPLRSEVMPRSPVESFVEEGEEGSPLDPLTIDEFAELQRKLREATAHEIRWMEYWVAVATGNLKPKFVFLTTEGCIPCEQVKQNVFTDPRVIKAINERYLPVKGDIEHWNVPSAPSVLVMEHDQDPQDQLPYYTAPTDPDKFLELLEHLK